MIKKYTLFVLLHSALLLHALPIKKPITDLPKMRPSKPTISPVHSVYRRTAKATLRPSWHNHLTNTILSASVEESFLLDFKPPAPTNFSQRAYIYQRYSDVMASFEQAKKDLTSFVYYQSIPSEKESLPPSQGQALLNRVLPLYMDLRNLDNLLQDPAVQHALTYMQAVLHVINPMLLNTLNNLSLVQEANITQQELRSFCLYPSTNTPFSFPSQYLDGKHIALINDDASILQVLESWHDWGLLLPQTTLKTHGDAILFLLWEANTPHKPDLVFTDIQLGDSTGYYIAYELRRHGYKGGIIALTSYAEDASTMQLLKSQGFDGFISLQPNDKIPLAQRITQAAQVFFQRKEQSPL